MFQRTESPLFPERSVQEDPPTTQQHSITSQNTATYLLVLKTMNMLPCDNKVATSGRSNDQPVPNTEHSSMDYTICLQKT